MAEGGWLGTFLVLSACSTSVYSGHDIASRDYLLSQLALHGVVNRTQVVRTAGIAYDRAEIIFKGVAVSAWWGCVCFGAIVVDTDALVFYAAETCR